MPPHCDSRDGPVVTAALQALDSGNVKLILPWVREELETELRDAFHLAVRARKHGGDATRVADEWFFETAVRLHREGEGAAYTGLKPAGVEPSPVIRAAEAAAETGDAAGLLDALHEAIERGVDRRLARVRATARHDATDVRAARRHVAALLDLEEFAAGIHEKATSLEHAHPEPPAAATPHA